MSAKDVWVIAEVRHGEVHQVSGELLGKGRGLADQLDEKLVAVLIGEGVEGSIPQLFAWGADRVIVCEHPELTTYRTLPFSHVVEELVKRHNPSIMLCGATRDGRDLAGRLAVRLNTGLTADAVELALSEKGKLEAWVPGFGGSMAAVITCPNSFPQMSTVRPGIFPLPSSGGEDGGEVIRFETEIGENLLAAKVLEQVTLDKDPLPDADVVIAVGLGSGGDLGSAEELAEILGGVLGATRPICDKGLLPRVRQIGQTGVSVRPDILLNLGISGASHYVTGTRDAKTIISINTDGEAPIFNSVDLGIVAPLEQVMERLLERFAAEEVVQ